LLDNEIAEWRQNDETIDHTNIIPDTKERLEMFKYLDITKDHLREEIREIKDAYVELKKDPFRPSIKLEMQMRKPKLNRYKFIHI
jgi:hypothetical protein